jgi:LysM repeat protein
VEGSSRSQGRRTLTPAVLASALFTVVCAATAIGYVAARGGLQMPVASTPPPVAAATSGPTEAAVVPTVGPTAAPSVVPSTAPTPSASMAAPTAMPTAGSPTLDPNDPLLALPGCPGLPGCFEYTIQRGDSLSGIASRYAIPVSTVLALNPEITDPRIVVVGRILYLGRDLFVRLPPCPGVADCSLYTVKPGDRLSTIAGTFGITTEAILAANPTITDPNAIFSGQVIHLPWPAEPSPA